MKPVSSAVNAYCYDAFQMMARFAVAPTPHNYEIFYSLVSDEESAVAKALRPLLASGHTLVNGDLDVIYERFVARGAIIDNLVALGDKLNAQVVDALGLTEATVRSNESFTEAVDQTGRSLAGNNDPKAMQALVVGLLENVQVMAAANHSHAESVNDLKSRISVLQGQIDHISKEANTDQLTGIGNRRFLDRVLGSAIARAHEQAKPLSVCFIDLDHFKAFNDAYGHQMGDAALRKVANILQSLTRQDEDLVARYGGEEFVLVLPGTPVGAAMQVVERIRLALSTKSFVDKSTGQNLGQVTASFGLTEITGSDTEASLLSRADQYLYEAKNSGRNRVVSDPMGAAMETITGRIKLALRSNDDVAEMRKAS